MFCTNCGAPIAPGQKFCNKCGTPFSPDLVNVRYPADPGFMQYPPKKKSKTWLIALISIFVVALLLTFSVMTARALVKGYLAKHKPESAPEPPEELTQNFDIEDFFDDDIFGEEEEQEDFGEDYISYDYADVYTYDDSVLICGNGTVDGSTVLYKGKTLDEFCDYIDDFVLGNGITVNRDMLADLIELHLVDPGLVENDEDFANIMMCTLVIAGEFGSQDLGFDTCSVYFDEPETYYYSVELDEETDEWLIDFKNRECYFNYGETEYTSAGEYGMCSEKTYTLWLSAVNEFFGIN